MIRKQLYLERRQDRFLKRLARPWLLPNSL